MNRVFLSENSAVMFIRCKSESTIISKIPNIIAKRDTIEKEDGINIECVENSNKDYINVENITPYYKRQNKISFEDFFEYQKKYIFFTVDFSIEDMMNLQYILVLNDYFNEYGVSYYLILRANVDSALFYKVSHYFGMQYPVNSNVYIRSKDSTARLSSKPLAFSPGEILPFFYINQDFYKSCLSSFVFDKDVFNIISVDRNNTIKILQEKYKNHSRTFIYLINCVYSYLARNPLNSVIEFLSGNIETPILSAMLFVAILSKHNYKESEYNIIYENCLDYSFSIEQLIENTFFYSKGGILSIRIHKNSSPAMSLLYKESFSNEFSIEMSLIDFEPERTIAQNFIELADADENEKQELKRELNSESALEYLFNPKEGSAIYKYFNKPNVIIQHYGLQTISLLARKTNSLLCIKNGNDFYTNNCKVFYKQTIEQYEYRVGVHYRIIIPISHTLDPFVYTGLNNNQYDYSYSEDEYNYINYSDWDILIPENRNKKIDYIEHLKNHLSLYCQPYKVSVINASNITSRLELEYLIKAILFLFSKNIDYNIPICIAITELKNKTLIKIALRFISLCYNLKGENNSLNHNEIFICNKDCDIEALIFGENYYDIIKNLHEQRIFGTINNEIFGEIKNTLNNIYRGDMS